MKNLFITLTVAALLAGPAVAADKADVMVPVKQFVDGFNKDDRKMIAAACAEQMSIIDEFPPYEWHGAGAIQKWLADFDVEAKKNGITDGRVTLGRPRHIDIEGDRAYVVIPANYSFKMKGRRMKETGSTMTLALQKEAGGWRLSGWSWAKR